MAVVLNFFFLYSETTNTNLVYGHDASGVYHVFKFLPVLIDLDVPKFCCLIDLELGEAH